MQNKFVCMRGEINRKGFVTPWKIDCLSLNTEKKTKANEVN